MKSKRKIYLKSEEVDKNVYELAIERISYLYSKFDNIVISFSGGKDSMTILELTIEVARKLNRLPVKTIFFDEEAISYETEEYVRKIYNRKSEVDLYWFCLPIKSNNSCSTKNPYWFPWHKDEKSKWVRNLPLEAITEIPGIDFYKQDYSLSEITRLLFPKEVYGNVAVILGIRAEESLLRRRSVIRKDVDNYIIKDTGDYYRNSMKVDNIYKCYPIYDWSAVDIWTAVKKFNWEYNKAYDILNMYGIKPNMQRVGPAFHSEAKKGLKQYRECFPAVWEKMQNRVEGANTGNKWGGTEIYGNGTIEEKPDNLSWEEFMLSYLNKLEGNKKIIVARQIRRGMKFHYNRTTDPILAVPHHETKIGWKYLIKLALIGDLKGRKIAQLGYIDEDTSMYKRVKKEYLEELKIYEEAMANGKKY